MSEFLNKRNWPLIYKILMACFLIVLVPAWIGFIIAFNKMKPQGTCYVPRNDMNEPWDVYKMSNTDAVKPKDDCTGGPSRRGVKGCEDWRTSSSWIYILMIQMMTLTPILGGMTLFFLSVVAFRGFKNADDADAESPENNDDYVQPSEPAKEQQSNGGFMIGLAGFLLVGHLCVAIIPWYSNKNDHQTKVCMGDFLKAPLTDSNISKHYFVEAAPFIRGTFKYYMFAVIITAVIFFLSILVLKAPEEESTTVVEEIEEE